MDYNDCKYIWTTLRADTTVRALVPSSVYTYAIFNGIQIPESETAKETINIYSASTFNGSLPINVRTVSVNCRAELESKSREIAIAVFDALNRINSTLSGEKFYTKVSVFKTIPPQDDTDVFNTPLDIDITWR